MCVRGCAGRGGAVAVRKAVRRMVQWARVRVWQGWVAAAVVWGVVWGRSGREEEVGVAWRSLCARERVRAWCGGEGGRQEVAECGCVRVRVRL